MQTTKLQAVNSMLLTVGEAPVDSLESGLFQAVTAETVLDETSRLVQMEDWDFNREAGLTFSPNSDLEIILPGNLYRVDAQNRYLQVIQRGNRLYDKKNHTFSFTSPVLVDVAWCFDFEELPEAARQYIYLSAARKFQMFTLGASDLAGFTQEDEQRALLRLTNFDSETADYNLFDNDPESSYIVNRD